MDFTCDLSSCVLNKRGECMKTFYNECPYFREVLAHRTELKQKLEFAKSWAKDYNEMIRKEKERKRRVYLNERGEV